MTTPPANPPIAERNVGRFEQTGRIDVDYLATLSADAVPALLRLPADVRDCALVDIGHGLATSSDPWFDTNVARNQARTLLKRETVGDCDRLKLFR